MAQQHPHSKEAERRALATFFNDPNVTIPEAIGLGLRSEDFFVPKNRCVFDAVLDTHESGGLVRHSVIKAWLEARDKWSKDMQTAVLDAYPDTPADESAFWTEKVIDKSLRRDELRTGTDIAKLALDDGADAYQGITGIQAQLDEISGRYVRMHNPIAANPADELRKSKGWFTDTGLPFIDRWYRLTSGEWHFIAGDPSSGKTTIAIQMAGHNIKQGVPVVLILAEADKLEITLSLLLQTGKVNAQFINQIRYNQTMRTEGNLKRIHDLWEELYGGLPLYIFEANGVDEVVSIISAFAKPALVMVDHAYAVVAQSKRPQGAREHQMFISLFSRGLAAINRLNHVGVMFNQFKLEGRNAAERGPDAQYGGSGVQNIASTLTHIWPAESGEASTASGFRLVRSKFWKVRALMLADEHGNTIDPKGEEDEYWLENKFRRIVPSLPIMQ